MEQDKHILTMHQILHDMRELYHTHHRNEQLDEPGQYDFINYNMHRATSWWRLEAAEEDFTYSNISPNPYTFIGGSEDSMQFLPLESVQPEPEISEIIGTKGKLHDLRQRAATLYEQL